MPKNLLEDIKPLSREPRKASKTEGASTVVKVHAAPEIQSALSPTPESAPQPTLQNIAHTSLPRRVPFEPTEPKHTSRHALWYIAAICVIGFLFSLSFLFESATVTVTPKSLPVAFDSTDTFTAVKDATDASAIAYTVTISSADESMKLPSTETKTESIAATGTVILYNAYSTAPYKLVKSTRLVTPDGRTYRMDTAATIPGYTKSGSTITPGSKEVTVTAAVAGESMNLDSSDFTLPGLAGTPQATKVYGRTKTAISGGISGTLYLVPQDAANAALGTLSDKLKASLLAKAKVQVPPGYIFYEGATVFTPGDSVQVPYSKEKDVPIALHGTLTAYLLKQDSLVKAIAAKSVSQYAGEPVKIPKLASLTLLPTNALSPATDTSFSFSLGGSADIIWVVNPDDVKKLLVSKKKSEFNTILSAVTSIEKAQVVIKPFWKSTFPKDPTRITVKVQ